jgi:hypothetical protein
MSSSKEPLRPLRKFTLRPLREKQQQKSPELKSSRTVLNEQQ